MFCANKKEKNINISLILEKTKGNLLWLKEKEWLIITKKDATQKNYISDILKKENFLKSILDFKNKELEVWSKITSKDNNKYEIKENIEAIIDENEDRYIWSQDLSSILNFDNQNLSENRIGIEHRENINNDFDEIIRIHLGKKETEVFLNGFYPYILLNMMVGNKLDSPQNIDMSFSIPTINYTDYVKFEIDLKTS